MEIAFKNQNLTDLLEINAIGNDDLNILGRISLVEGNLQTLNRMHTILNSNFQNATYRQKILEDGLKSVLNRVTIERMLLDSALGKKGRFDNFFIYNDNSKTLEWERIDIAESDDGIASKNINLVYEVSDQSIYVQELSSEFTIVSLKLPYGVSAAGLYLDKNKSDISYFKYKNISSGEWELVDVSVASDFTIERQGICLFDLNFQEIEISFKNKLINTFYYFDLKAIPFAKKIKKDFAKIKSERPIPMNSIYACPLVDYYMYAEGALYINENMYNVQIPFDSLNSAQISRLITDGYQNLYTTTGRCPYPVSTSEVPVLMEEPGNPNYGDVKVIPDWQFSVDQITWYPKTSFSSFVYPGLANYSTTPRYMYFKTSGYYENIYIYYPIERNINCAWPLSEDGIIFYNGNGISIKNAENIPISFEINFICSSDSLENLQKEFPIGFIGID